MGAPKRHKCYNTGRTWFKKGAEHSRYWLGKHRSKKTNKKISDSLKGNIPYNKGQKGLYRHPKKIREQISATMKSKRSRNWLLEKTNSQIRACPEYQLWRKAVWIRDDYTCQSCGKRGYKLNAHHILSFTEFSHKRFDIKNGITLCRKCHKEVHWGKK
ncbi:hypothetical protein LCGC14_2392970 [marine sediment metagenome]|uniref:HNH nuclease domain-containing protein n=1 Tax=marine sediment metagenome TaxID=412755 RepID=A0A0F9E9Y0_9ZZZZ